MNSIAARELISRRSQVEENIKSRQDRISVMLKERSNLFILSNTIQKWATSAELIERFSQGNPTLRSYREACLAIRTDVKDIRGIMEELLSAAVPNFDSVADAIDRIDAIVEDDQQTGTNVEELRAVIGEACGTLEVITGLLYD
eukprot:gene7170-12835_t